MDHCFAYDSLHGGLPLLCLRLLTVADDGCEGNKANKEMGERRKYSHGVMKEG